jgi:hypothetical protein
MRALRLAVLLVVVSIVSGCATSDWRNEDTRRMQVANTALIAFDTAQTLHIARCPGRYYEQNPVLGKHPSEATVILGGIAYGTGSWFLAKWLDARGWDKTARALQYVQFSGHGIAITNNVTRGLKPFGSDCNGRD